MITILVFFTVFLAWSYYRSLTFSYSVTGGWLCGPNKPVCQLRSQVCYSSQFHHSTLILHWHGHCKVSRYLWDWCDMPEQTNTCEIQNECSIFSDHKRQPRSHHNFHLESAWVNNNFVTLYIIFVEALGLMQEFYWINTVRLTRKQASKWNNVFMATIILIQQCFVWILRFAGCTFLQNIPYHMFDL